MSSTSNSNANDSGCGYLEISDKGFGFLRTETNHFHPKPTDIFVTPDTIKRSFLREGSHIVGPTQPPHRGTSPQLKSVDKVNGMRFEDYVKAVRFENLTSIDPIEKFRLETSPDLIETRVIDMVTPIGRGTRGLIVSPPRTGKTTILKQIANAVTANHPNMHLMMLLVDERPEEVTDMKRTVKGEVIASSSDNDTANHIRVAQLVVERAKRLVEQGRDAFEAVLQNQVRPLFDVLVEKEELADQTTFTPEQRASLEARLHQLVARIGDEAALLGVGTFEAVEHLVERIGE